MPIMDVLRKLIESFPKKLRDHALGPRAQDVPAFLDVPFPTTPLWAMVRGWASVAWHG